MGVPLFNPSTGEVREFPSRIVNSRLEEGWEFASGDHRVHAIVPGPVDPNTRRPRSYDRVSVPANEANALRDSGALWLSPHLNATFENIRDAQSRARVQRIWAEGGFSEIERQGAMLDRLTGGGRAALGVPGMIASLMGEDVDTRASSLMAPVSATIGEALLGREFSNEDVEEALSQRRLARPIDTLLAELTADIMGAAAGTGSVARGASLAQRMGVFAGPEAMASAAGMGTTRALTSRLAPLVRSGTLTEQSLQSIANVAGVTVEGGSSAIMNLLLRSQLEDSELSTSQLIADGSMGAILGLGLGTLGELAGPLARIRRAVPSGGDEVIHEPRRLMQGLFSEAEQLTQRDIQIIQDAGGHITPEVMAQIPERRWDVARRFLANLGSPFTAVDPAEQAIVHHPAILELSHQADTVVPQITDELADNLTRARTWQREAIEELTPSNLSNSRATELIGDVDRPSVTRRLNTFLSESGSDIHEVLHPSANDNVRFNDIGRLPQAESLRSSLLDGLLGRRRLPTAPERLMNDVDPGTAYNQLRIFRSELARQVVDPTDAAHQTRPIVERMLRRVDALLEDPEMFGQVATHHRVLRDVIHGSGETPGLEQRLAALERTLAHGDPSGATDEVFSKSRLDRELRSQTRPGGGEVLEASVDYFRSLEVGATRLQQSGAALGLSKSPQDIMRLSVDQQTALHRARAHVQARARVSHAEIAANRGSGFKPELAIIGGLAVGGLGGGAIGAGIGTMLSFLQRPTAAYMRLHNIRRALSGWQARRTAALGQISRRVRAAASGEALGPSEAVGSRVLLIPVVNATSYKDRVEQFQQTREHIETLMTNPELFAEHLSVMTAGFGTISPEHQAQAQMQAWRALEYLASRMPAPGTQRLIGRDRMAPSSIQISMFSQALEGIEDPMSLYEDIANFRLTQEKAKAVGYVYPRIMQIIAQDMAVTIGELVADGVEVPYQFRLQLGVLTGAPTDDSLNPSFLMRTQSMYAQTTAQDSAQRAAAGQRTTRIPEHTQSESQQIESRL